MSDPALTKLLKIDSELSAQETELTTQLEALKVKRSSLQNVLQMFDSSSKKVAANGNGATSPALASDPKSVVAETTLAAPVETPVKISRNRPKSGKKNSPAKPRSKAPSDNKLTRRGWRRYVREEFRKTPLPDVVFGVLKGQPKKVFEIGGIVDTIFVEKIPQWARKGARERVSNILAEGARKDRWHRGKTGCYSLSKVSKG